MLRLRAADRTYRAWKWPIRIDGQRAGFLPNGDEKSYPLAPGKHTLVMGSRYFHSRTLHFETDGLNPTEVLYGKTPGGISRWLLLYPIGTPLVRALSDWAGFSSLQIVLVLVLLTGFVGLLWHYLAVTVPFGGEPVLWLASDKDPRLPTRGLVLRPLPGYPYMPEQLDPAIRAQYAAEIGFRQRKVRGPHRRARRVGKPLRGYPYHPEQLPDSP